MSVKNNVVILNMAESNMLMMAMTPETYRLSIDPINGKIFIRIELLPKELTTMS